MLRKVLLTAVIAGFLACSGFAQEENAAPAGEQAGQEGVKKAAGQKTQEKPLLAQLRQAYENNDREKMGEILDKMESRQEKRLELRRAGQKAHRGVARKARRRFDVGHKDSGMRFGPAPQWRGWQRQFGRGRGLATMRRNEWAGRGFRRGGGYGFAPWAMQRGRGFARMGWRQGEYCPYCGAQRQWGKGYAGRGQWQNYQGPRDRGHHGPGLKRRHRDSGCRYDAPPRRQKQQSEWDW